VIPDRKEFVELVLGHQKTLYMQNRTNRYRKSDSLYALRRNLITARKIPANKIDSAAMQIAHGYNLAGNGKIGIAPYLSLQGFTKVEIGKLLGIERAALSKRIRGASAAFENTLLRRFKKRS
jgi:hypothetical protein